VHLVALGMGYTWFCSAGARLKKCLSIVRVVLLRNLNRVHVFGKVKNRQIFSKPQGCVESGHRQDSDRHCGVLGLLCWRV